MSDKYDKWLRERKLPEKVSILELSVLADKLGIDMDAIRERQSEALFEELLGVVREAGVDVGG